MIFFDENAAFDKNGMLCVCYVLNLINAYFKNLVRQPGFFFGNTFIVTIELKRSKKWNTFPAFIVNGYIACKAHHGSIISEILNNFVKDKNFSYCIGSNSQRSVLMNQ